MLAKRTGDEVNFDSDITIKIKNNKDVPQIGFILVGSYFKGTDSIEDMRIILQNAVCDEKLLAECPRAIETFPDGTHHPAITFNRSDNTQVSLNGECLIAKLPTKLSKIVEFLLNNFSDIGVGMVKTGSIKLVGHNGVKSFFSRIATGELKILLK